MASSDNYRSWIDQARREQRTLRDHGCDKAAERMQSGIDADYSEMSKAMQREEAEEHHERVYGRNSDNDD